MKKLAAIYARVSSQKQKEDCTIDSQISALRSWSMQEDYHIPETWIFSDAGVSGGTLQRPALDMLRDLIRVETIDAVLIYAPDRLARSYPHQLILMEEFRKYGVKVHFLKAPPEQNTPEGKMFGHLQGIFAEYERSLIFDRSRRGRIHKAQKGDPSILSSPAFGYKRIKNQHGVTFEIEEWSAAIVKEIFRMYLHENASLMEIARTLTEKGIKSPRGHQKWHVSSVRGILTNSGYIGTVYYGKTERHTGGGTEIIRRYRSGKRMTVRYSRKYRSPDACMPISMPQIVGENDYELAQERLKTNRALAARNTKHPSLLQGLVICGECGLPFYKFTKRKGQRVWNRYRCRSRCNKDIKKCSNSIVDQEELDELVFSEVINLLKTPSVIYEELARRAKEVSNGEEIERQDVNVKKELSKILRERDRLLDAYQSGFLDLKELSKRHQEIDERHRFLEKNLLAIQAKKLEKENCVDVKLAFDLIVKRLQAKADGLSFDEKRRLTRLLVEKVVVSHNAVKIVHCVSPQEMIRESDQLRSVRYG